MSAMTYRPWEEILRTGYAGRRTFPLIEPEMPTFMGRRHATSPEDLRGADAVIIGAPYVASSTGEYFGVLRNP